MAPGNQLISLALFGRPVKNSLSPAIHRMFAQQCDLQISYRLIEAGHDEFPEKLEKFRLSGGTGCNVTLPLKRDAWQLATFASEEVKLAEAANTLSLGDSPGWIADTTDGIGLVTDMTANHGLDISGLRVLVLGAGGATASVLGALLAQQPAHVTLVNRKLERAHALAGRFAAGNSIRVVGWDALASKSGFDLVINSTSLGHQGRAPAISAALFAPGAVCYDLNYHVASRPLRKLCANFGKAYIDGLGMLVEQAAASFHIWTGERPDSRVVIRELRDRH